jgi:plasmid rolling circle replication initiator protein Rep
MENPPIGGSNAAYLSELSPKDKPWDVHKEQSRAVASRYEQGGYEKYSKRIWECAQTLQFALRSNETGEVKFKLYAARFCRVRFCPVCQWRKSMMWRSRFIKVLPRILEERPKARFIFLTLTIKNCDLRDLRDTLARMNKAWKLLTLRKQFPAIGWVKSVEVTRGEDGTAHPHFHCLLLVHEGYFKRGYLSHATWTNLWKDCLKVEYNPIVNVKVVKDRKVKKSLSEVYVPEVPVSDVLVPATAKVPEVPGVSPDVLAGVLETLKYSVKPSDLAAEADWLIELTKQMHKSRAVGLGGIFKEYMSEDEPEDLIHTDTEEEEEVQEDDLKLIFDWAEMARRYAKKSA